MALGRPAPFDGAFVDPKSRFRLILRTARGTVGDFGYFIISGSIFTLYLAADYALDQYWALLYI